MKPNNGSMIYRKAYLPICNRKGLFSFLFLLFIIVCPIACVCIYFFTEIPIIITTLFSILTLIDFLALCFIPFTGLKIKKGKLSLIYFYRIIKYKMDDVEKIVIKNSKASNKRCFINVEIILKDNTIKYFDSSNTIKYNKRKLATILFSISKKEYQSFVLKVNQYDFISINN
jgi:hypothetical protein